MSSEKRLICCGTGRLVARKGKVLEAVTHNHLNLKVKQKSHSQRPPCKNCTMVHHPLDKSNKTKDSTSVIQLKEEPFLNHYSVEKEIGRGKFAVVKRCKHKITGVVYAAKFLRKRRKGKDCRADVLREVEMLQESLQSPRLVHLLEVYETSHEIILVMEYAAGGELHRHFIQEDRFAEKDVIRLLKQVLEGLVYLHDRNIVHLDVKPSNVLLTQDIETANIKLCDFGFARRLNSEEEFRDIIGTPDYVAPEILSYEPIRTSSDMWSVGVLAYVMLTGASPFAGDNNQETFLNISQVNLEFPEELFSDVSHEAQDFITKLLIAEPRSRLSAQECLDHSWLQARDAPCSPVKFGSPLGQRRALTPPSPDTALDVAPVKKSKSDETVSLKNVQNAMDITTKDTLPASEISSVEFTLSQAAFKVNRPELKICEVAEYKLCACRALSLPNSPCISKKDVSQPHSVPVSPIVSKRSTDCSPFEKNVPELALCKLDELQENVNVTPVCV